MKKTLTLILLCLAALMSCQAQTIDEMTQEQFAQEFLDSASNISNAGLPAVVDFNATWCGPCRQLTPILRELAKKYAGRVRFYSIDVDKNRQLSQALQIRSIPFVLFLPAGSGQPSTMLGLRPKAQVEQQVKALLH